MSVCAPRPTARRGLLFCCASMDFVSFQHFSSVVVVVVVVVVYFSFCVEPVAA